MHSAFFQTPLEILLRYLGASSLILCGLATNSCIVCTAHDANMRDFRLIVPSDCSAARTRREHQQAIEHIRAWQMHKVCASSSLRLEDLRKETSNARNVQRLHEWQHATGDATLSLVSPAPVLSNAEIADRLASLAQLLSTQKENPYKVKAYQRAAGKIRDSVRKPR